MRTFLIIFLVLHGMKGIAQHDKILEALKKNELELYKAVEVNDIRTIDKSLHPNFAVQSNSGFFQPKSTLLDKFRNGGNSYLVFRPKDDSIIVVNKRLVIASGSEIYIHKTGTEKNLEKIRHFIHVWAKYKKRWVLASRYISN